MNGDPLLIQPEGALGFIALGSAGAIFQDSNGQVIKTTLKHDVKGCSKQVIEHHPRILDCLETKEKSLHFPFCRLGNLRDYLQHNGIDNNIRDQWVRNAIDSIAVIHAYGVIHADISPRNFLVADDLSIKLCDFAGSAIGDLQPLVEEEDRYRISPLSPRNFKTYLFALGCLIYEISTGIRPYHEIDTEEIEKLYKAHIFPKLDGLKYQNIIYKCWTSQYEGVDELQGDYSHCTYQANDGGNLAALWKYYWSGLMCFGNFQNLRLLSTTPIGLVATFLQKLECFEGILFLTTNQPDGLDAAILNRVHLSLIYSDLNHDARKEIFQQFLQKDIGIKVNVNDQQLTALAQVILNGRQIKNTMSIACTIAAKDGELRFDHVRSALAMNGRCVPDPGLAYKWNKLYE
ncbi:hypothetical protein DIZ76_012405 [Coccidioides immitis]|nr:hypothetical protein DIZ76_012405 [Coccidioides immitis]